MSTDKNRTIYEISTGTMVDNKLTQAYIAGHAVHEEGNNFYLVRLMMFPGMRYYLCKNYGKTDQYTLYTKQIRNEKGLVRFQNPVGFGRLQPVSKTHLEIYLPLLRAQVFMSLFPKTV